ncbi:MAG: PLP-dependent aminotransferase family protein [Spirochaetaceae bacterium]|nr:MAG: PLP-dependent aminotransferase family protein [Spirochaetaceae bacterium]
MIVDLERNGKKPLYLQLKEKIGAMIAERLMLPGSRLPATRDLALSLGVSRNTVVQAYQELEAEGLINSRVGRGAFVTLYPLVEISTPAAKQESCMSYEGLFSAGWSRANADLVSVFEQLAQPPSKSLYIDMASDQPNSGLLPVAAFGECLKSAVRRYGRSLFTTGSPCGFKPLLEYLPTLLARRNVMCRPENLMIVSGVQQALNLIGRLFIDPGDTVLLQHFTYPGALGMFRSFQSTCIGIPTDHEGLCIDVLERILRHRRPKLLYIVPTFHNPTGTTLPAERRRRLVELAREHAFLVVEDDYAHDLAFDGREAYPLKSWDTVGGIIHLGSFSESLFPGIRLSWIVASKPIIERLALLKQSYDLYTNRIIQGALLEYCRKGCYDRELKRKRQVYARRCDSLFRAMEYHFPDAVTWRKPKGGLFQWVDIPESLDAFALLLRTRERGVVFTPDRMFAVEEWSRGGFRLGFTSPEEDQIPEGVKIIGETLKDILATVA